MSGVDNQEEMSVVSRGSGKANGRSITGNDPLNMDKICRGKEISRRFL